MSDPKIDSWMAFYGDEFFRAVKGYSKEVGFMYLLAIWFYRSHNKCMGIHNDDEFMRNICECEKKDWPEIKPIIFGYFFKKESGLWHQKRAREIYQEALEIANKNKARAKKGAIARWSK